MKRAGMFLFLSFLCVNSVLALSFENLCNDESVVGVELPSAIPFSDEVLNLYLADKGVGSIILSNKVIESVSCDVSNESTYNVFVKDEQTINEILEAEDKIAEYHKKKSEGSFKIEAVGFFRGIKLGLINFFSRFF